MRPDFEQYRNAGERLIPCCPPLLSGIGKVYVATENERKLTAVRDLLGKYPILRGTEFLVPEPHKLTGEEPPWENAVLVSRDKVENVVSAVVIGVLAGLVPAARAYQLRVVDALRRVA